MNEDAEGLELGRRIRTLREEKGLSLRAVSDAAGVSESFLSQVERGVASPSVASLRRLAEALGESVGSFFEGPSAGGRVVRAGARRRLVHPQRHWEDVLLTPRESKRLQVILSTIEPGGGSGDEPYTHDSDEECVVVLRGRMEFWVDDERYELSEGDSLLFESRRPHRNINPGPSKAEVLWIITPPSY
ncbi:MAG: cupin domain-containing protein [Actinobacteria bacterium]|nr:cupin domain-containing protein [Actinomycetota bacterium]